jgi:hypothetical protein
VEQTGSWASFCMADHPRNGKMTSASTICCHQPKGNVHSLSAICMPQPSLQCAACDFPAGLNRWTSKSKAAAPNVSQAEHAEAIHEQQRSQLILELVIQIAVRCDPHCKAINRSYFMLPFAPTHQGDAIDDGLRK